MIPAPLLLLWKYRRLAGYAVAAVALAVVAWRIAAWHKAYTELPQVKESLKASQSELATLRKSVDTADKAIKAKDEAYQRTLGQRDAYGEQVSTLLTRPPVDPKTLIVRVPTDAPGITCPDRGPEFRLRYNEIAAGPGND